MPEEPAPAAFAAWMAAETAAYDAIHALHQRSQGGRLGVPDPRIEQIARLRKEADVRFAGLWGALGASLQPQAVGTAPVQAPRIQRPAPGPRQRMAVELPENRPGLA